MGLHLHSKVTQIGRGGGAGGVHDWDFGIDDTVAYERDVNKGKTEFGECIPIFRICPPSLSGD
ncbi:hypothetical protein SK128_002539 [Halocaridina rubra]|uniref:Uncharacterized protein n=1 Tax=Halocaridina rubra TaxID=373956 RepID=A0AAN8X0C5_HALRR